MNTPLTQENTVHVEEDTVSVSSNEEVDDPHQGCQLCVGRTLPVNLTSMITYLCGHQVHSECFFSTRWNDSCAICDERIWRFRGHNEETNADKDEKKKAQELLDTDEDFQTALLQLKQSAYAYSSAVRMYNKDFSVINRDFRQTIRPHIEAIRHFRKAALVRVKNLESTKRLRSARALAARRYTTLLRNYKVTSYGLYGLHTKRAHGKRLDFLRFTKWGYPRNHYGPWRSRTFFVRA